MASVAGTKVELTLTTALTDSTATLTVALAADAVEDGATNGILAVAATGVTNAIIANEPPEFSSPTATRSVPENTAANTNIGAALPAATDADNDPLTYTLEGADAASFGFNAATRQLSTKSGVTYDHETTSSYSVTLKADDDNGGSDTLAVTITITDVEEPPDRPAAPSVTAVGGHDGQPGGELDGAVEHRSRHRQLRPAVPGRHRRELDQRPPERERHQRDDREPDREHLLPGAGAGEKRRRRQPLVAARFGADRRAGGARRAAQPRRHARQPAGDAQLGPAIRRRGGHRLRIRAGPFRDLDLHGQHGHQLHGDRPDERPELHVSGAGGQQRRARARPPPPRRASPPPRCPARRRA